MIAEHAQTATETPIVLQCVDLCKCYNGVVQASDHMNIRILDVLTGNPVIIRTLERQPQERLQTDSVIVVL